MGRSTGGRIVRVERQATPGNPGGGVGVSLSKHEATTLPAPEA